MAARSDNAGFASFRRATQQLANQPFTPPTLSERGIRQLFISRHRPASRRASVKSPSNQAGLRRSGKSTEAAILTNGSRSLSRTPPPFPCVLRLRLPDRLPLHILDRIGPAARNHHIGNMKPICKLCTNEAALIKAHVIPKSFWEIEAAQPPPRMVTNIEGVFPKRIPIGVYDQTIVCERCERSFSDYDSYAAQLFLKRFNEFEEVSETNRRLTGYVLRDVNYRFSSYSPSLSFGERLRLYIHSLAEFDSAHLKKRRVTCSREETPVTLRLLRLCFLLGTRQCRC